MQEITVNRDLLLAALERVKPTVARGKTHEIHKCFCFRGGFIQTYDTIAGTTVTPFSVEGMEFAITASKFYDICSRLSEEITFKLNTDAWRLYINSGRNKTWMACYPVRDFPEYDSDGSVMFCDAPDLVQAIETVGFTMGKNALKPELQGVAISGNHVYSCDGLRLTRASISKQAYGRAILPPTAVEQLKRLGQPDYMFQMQGVSGDTVAVGCVWGETGTVYKCQVLVGAFPVEASDKAIAGFAGQHTVRLPSLTVQAIERVSIMSPTDPKLIVENIPGEGLVIRTDVENEGAAKETLPWDFEHPFKFGVKPEFFAAAARMSLNMDLTDVVSGGSRLIRATEEGLDTIVALMVIADRSELDE